MLGKGHGFLEREGIKEQQFPKWGPWTFQGVCDAKPVFIITFRVCWPSCHFNLFLVLTFALMRQENRGQTAGTLGHIKTVGPDCSGGRCVLCCHALTIKITPVSHKNVLF